MNDLWRFNIKEAIWKKLNPSGEIPEKRSNHSAVYDPIGKRLTIYDKPGLISSRILFFGGGSSSKKRFNETHAYDIRTGTFQLLETVS